MSDLDTGAEADDIYGRIAPNSTLKQNRITLQFVSSGDEAAYSAYVWLKCRHHIQIAVVLLIVFVGILSFQNALQNYEAGWVLLVFFLGRLIPSALLVGFSCINSPIAAEYWSMLSTVCCTLLVVSSTVVPFICVEHGDNLQLHDCDTVSHGYMPWATILSQIIISGMLSTVLRAKWFSCGCGVVCSLAVLLALLLPKVYSEEKIGFVFSICSAVACMLWTSWQQDMAMRIRFRREVANRRKITTMIDASVSRLVAQEQYQHLSELIKRSPCVMLELSRDFIINFASPACASLFGWDATDLFHRQNARYMHVDDIAAVERQLTALMHQHEANRGAAKEGQDFCRIELRRRRNDGSYIWVEMTAQIVERWGVGAVFFTMERDISHLKKQKMQEVPKQPRMLKDQPAANEAASHPLSPTGSPSSSGISQFTQVPRKRPAASSNANVEFDASYEKNMFYGITLLRLFLEPATSKAAADQLRPMCFRQLKVMQQLCKQLSGLHRTHSPVLSCTPEALQLKPLLEPVVQDFLAQTSSTAVFEVEAMPPSQIRHDPFLMEIIVTTALLACHYMSKPEQQEGGHMDQKQAADCNSIVISSTSSEINLRFSWALSSLDTFEHISDYEDFDPILQLIPDASHVNAAISIQKLEESTIEAARASLCVCSHLCQQLGGNISICVGDGAVPQLKASVMLPHPATPRTMTIGRALPLLLTQVTNSPSNAAASAAASATAHVQVEATHAQPTTTISTAITVATATTNAGTTSAKPQQNGMHVLFVDDEQVNRRLGERMLKRIGCTYVILDDGDAVYDAVRTSDRKFTAILMDIVMQRMDGDVACQQLREKNYDLPIVAMTGATSEQDVQRFLANGFDSVLPKPFTVRDVHQKLIECQTKFRRT